MKPITPSLRSSACGDIVVENALNNAVGREKEKLEDSLFANIIG